MGIGWGQGDNDNTRREKCCKLLLSHHYLGKTSVKFGLQSPSKYCLDAGDIVA